MSRGEKPTVAVIGPGRMGTGITEAMALAGYPVQLVDLKDRSVDQSRRALADAEREVTHAISTLASIGYLDESGRESVRRLIAYCDVTRAEETVSRADVIFEAVPEVLEIKRAAYGRIGAAASGSALIGSTTSTFAVDTLASFVREPSRFMNTHWLNPPTLMPVIELTASAATSAGAVEAMVSLLEDAGKVPVRCAPSAGFIIPRIQALAMNEAARLVEEGVADAETVDTACRLGFGIRFATMGLIEFIDWGGADTVLRGSNYLVEALGSDRFTPPTIVAEKVESGAVGVKAGRGFHDLADRDLEEYQRETLRKLVALLQHVGALRPPVVNGPASGTNAEGV